MRWLSGRPPGRGHTRVRPKLVLAAGTFLMAATVPWAGRASAAPPAAEWSNVSVPAVGGSRGASLYGIACSTATDCVAVGTYSLAGKGSYNKALVEDWDGRVWSVGSTPALGGTGNSLLDGISCVSASACMAVGDHAVPPGAGGGAVVVETLVESWDGRTWTVVPSPDVVGADQSVLTGVSCLSVATCFAVGSSGAGPSSKMLVESWDGKAWSIDPSPDPAGSQANQLNGVSCSSAQWCVAVGFDDFPGTSLIETWSGQGWSTQVGPGPSGTRIDQLYGVSCTSAIACVAVGSIGDGTAGDALVESWDGRSWSITPRADPATTLNIQLSGVACTAATDCTAVGSYNVGTGAQTLIESSDGGAWSIVPSPSLGAMEFDSLFALACPSRGRCTSVGNFDENIDTFVQPLIEATAAPVQTGRGLWSITPSPNASAAGDDELAGVSCGSPKECTAVGFAGHGTTGRTLVESWNGRAWRITPSPDVNASGKNELAGVSCPSPRSCTAVGFVSQGATARTLVESWNGRTWYVLASGNVEPSGNNELTGVSCPSPRSCTAVGYVGSGRTARTLVESWNGRTWSVTPSPDVNVSEQNELASVSCPSPRSCTAVGFVGDGPTARTLVESWNGRAWSIAVSPDPVTAEDNQLAGVSCVSAVACTAVGLVANGSTGRTLVESWNGRTWSIVSTPDPATTQSVQLEAVSCTSTSKCAAAGNYASLRNLHDQTLLEMT